MHRKLMIVALVLVSFSALTTAQSPPDFCDTVRYMMAREITPYDLGVGGGIIDPDVPFEGEFSDEYYADTWSFSAFRPRNDVGTPQEGLFTTTIDSISSELNLEVALFTGMENVPDLEGRELFQPIAAGQALAFPITRDAAYTLIVRRQDVRNQTPGSYRINSSFPQGDPINVQNPRNNTTNTQLEKPPVLVNGHVLIQGGQHTRHLTTRVRHQRRNTNEQCDTTAVW